MEAQMVSVYKCNLENISFSLYTEDSKDQNFTASGRQSVKLPLCRVYAVLWGRLTVHISQDTFVLRENDVLFVPGNTQHIVENRGTKECHYDTVRFDYCRNTLRECGDYFGQMEECMSGGCIRCEAAETLTGRVSRWNEHTKWNRNRGQNDASLELEACELILSMVRSLFEGRSCKEKRPESNSDNVSRIQKVNRLIFRCFDRDITINDVAGLLYLSPRQTTRFIQQNFGMSLHELVTEHRMHVARRLLEESDSSIEEIAGYVGYKSVRGFYYAFKKEYQQIPQLFRGKQVG